MKELLRAEGYTVLARADGPSAIETSKRHTGTIHLLVTDMVMPKMQGRELAMQLIQQRPGLKVLYITGYADASTLEDANVLEKPFMPETLLHKIHEVLSTPDELRTVRTG